MKFDAKVIIESSLVLVSVFASIGLLLGAATEEFKLTYIYLGYMLYHSIPFILASFCAIISTMIHQRNKLEIKIITHFSVSFYLTGLVSLLHLSASTAQTILLPSDFLFIQNYQSILFMELITFILFLLIPILIENMLSGKNLGKFRQIDVRRLLLSLFGMLFVGSFFIMGMFGSLPENEVLESGTVFLSGEPNYTKEIKIFKLNQADLISIKIASADENHRFSFTFLDEKNLQLYTNEDTRILASPIRTDYAIVDSSFQETIKVTGNYSVVFYSSYFNGTQVSYSIDVYRVKSSISTYSVFFVTIFSSILFGLLIAEREKPIIRAPSYVS